MPARKALAACSLTKSFLSLHLSLPACKMSLIRGKLGSVDGLGDP